MKLKMNRSKTLILCAVSVIAVTVSIPSAQAGHAGAFLGGIAVARVGSNMRDRRDYQEDQAYYSQQQAYYSQQQAQAAQSQAYSQPTTEEQLAKLQDLAAKGYITPEEYKAKKKAILDNM
jgi:membrane protease subunit (stomatin/prohibitin family)